MKHKKIWAAAVLTAVLGASAAFAATRETPRENLWIHVKVHGGDKGEKVTINLPLSVVEKTSGLIPADARSSGRIQIDKEDLSKAELRQIWDEVRRQPDATFVTVDEVDGNVRVAKQGDYLMVHANDHGAKKENVQVRIPTAVVNALLSGEGDQFNISAAIQALAQHGEGELVTVTGDDETVRIWVDGVAEAR